MDAIILYIVKQLGYSAVFAGYYWLFLRKANFASWNRAYLIVASILTVLLPFIHIPFTVAGKPLELPVALLATTAYQHQLQGLVASTSTIVVVQLALLACYALVACGLLLLLVRAVVKVRRLKRESNLIYMHGIKVYITNRSVAPFSFFKSVFWSSELSIDSSDGQQILAHEMEHIRSNHSADKLLLELACTFCWINPFFWLFKRELSLVHEFLADRASVSSGGAEALSRLILCSLYPRHRAVFSNQFFQSTIKRRLAMITKSNTRYSSFRKLMIIPTALLVLGIFAFTTDDKQEKVATYEDVFQKPTFQGGDANEFSLWVNKEVKYPQEAIAKKIEGQVLLRFRVNKNGEVDEVTIINSANSSLLDDEAVRVVKASPRWSPGFDSDGKEIGVIFSFPIHFQLQH